MPHRRTTALAAMIFIAACSPSGPPAPPPPPALAWEVAAPTPAVYVQSDTVVVEVDAGGQTLQVDVYSDATLAATFAPAGDGATAVTIDFEAFAARQTNPMGPTTRASEADIQGTLDFVLDPRGRVTVTGEPELSGNAPDFLTGAAMAQTLFPRLPGRAVTPGDTWTDTIRVDSETPSGSIEAESVVTYTAGRDTTVAGRRLLRVDLRSEDQRYVEGSQGGMDLSQDLSGDSEGWFLWDLEAHELVESVTESELTGTMDVAAAPIPFSVRLRGTSVLRLRPGM